MFNSRDIAIAERMIKYCEDIATTMERFGNTLDAFLQDRDYRNSVSMSILQIGELSANLSDEFKVQTRNLVPWGLVKGMRNHIAHGYEYMSSEDIFSTASHDVAVLNSNLHKVITIANAVSVDEKNHEAVIEENENDCEAEL